MVDPWPIPCMEHFSLIILYQKMPFRPKTVFKPSRLLNGQGGPEAVSRSVDDSLRGATRAKDAQGTPDQSHLSPSIPVCEDEKKCARGQAHNLSPGPDSTWAFTGVPRLQENTPPVGPYRRPMPRVLGQSQGAERFLVGEVSL